MIIKLICTYLIYLAGYWIGKCTGMKEGYRNCHRDLLKAKIEERTHIGSSFDNFLNKENIHIDKKEIDKRLNAIYDGIYDSEEL